MVIEKDDKITTSLENESYKGIKTIAKDLEKYFDEMHIRTEEGKQQYVDELYNNLSDAGIKRLDKVIELYNADHPAEPLTQMSDKMSRYQQSITDITALLLQYGDKYGKENADLDKFIYGEFTDSLQNVKYDDIQNVIDEINKKLHEELTKQEFSDGKDERCLDTFKMLSKQYGKDNLARIRITDFAKAEAEAKRLKEILYLDPEKAKNMTKDEIALEKAKKASDFKFLLSETERLAKPEDFQATINILDRTLSREGRKTLDAAIKSNNKQNTNKYETRRIKLSEAEKDSSWQKISAESIKARRLRDFRIELDNLKHNKEKPKDRLDTGILNQILRAATNLQRLIEKTADFISESILYKHPDLDKNSSKEKQTKKHEQENQASPFYAVMREAFKEKGEELITLVSREAITKEQAEQMFIKDMAYVRTLDKERQEQIMSGYTNSIVKGMQRNGISVNAKNTIREFIANYEAGKYEEQIDSVMESKDFDWGSIYQESSKDNQNQERSQQKEIKKPSVKMSENDKKSIESGNNAKQAWLIGMKTAEKENKTEFLTQAISEFSHNHPEMKKEQIEEYAQMAVSVALTHAYSDELVKELGRYDSDAFKAADEKSRISILLEGAAKVDTADKVTFIINNEQPQLNAYEEELDIAIKNAIKNISSNKEKQQFLTQVADNTKFTKQQYFLAMAANNFGLQVRSDVGMKSEGQILRKIDKLAGVYDKKSATNNERINTEQGFIGLCERVPEGFGSQKVFDALRTQLKNNDKALKMLKKDMETYNKIKGREEISYEPKKQSQNILKSGLKNQPTVEAPKPQHTDFVDFMTEEISNPEEILQTAAPGNIIDVEVEKEKVNIKEDVDIEQTLIDAFNNGKNAEKKLIKWSEGKSETDIRNMIAKIDNNIMDINAASRLSNAINNNADFIGAEVPNSMAIIEEAEEDLYH